MTRPKSTRPTNSGHRHVFYDANRGQYYVRIKHEGKYYTAGKYFDLVADAAKAASELRQSLGIPDIDKPFARTPKKVTQ